MLSGLTRVLVDHFRADICLLCLLDRETGELELKAIDDRHDLFRRLGADRARGMLERVLEVQDQILVERLSKAGAGIHVAAAPIIMGRDERLGALLLAREQPAFGADEVTLLETAESQIDSAVIQGYAYHDLQQRNKELEAIYRIDHIRDRHLSFDEMLDHVLRELRDVVEVEMAFVMLYSRAGHRLELRACSHDDLFRVSPGAELIDRAAHESLERNELVCRNELEGELRSLLCLPLILNDEIIGVLGVANRLGARGFRDEDCRLLYAIASQMDTAIFESLERRRLRQVLERSVDPRVMERLLANPDVDFLKGERAVLSVLYADLRGSTSLSESTAPELVVEFVNDYLARMTEVVLSHEGTLDKFVGDEVIALFGAPFPQDDHALRAVRVALEMQRAHQGVMESWRARRVDPAPVGIGIASGELTVGEMGCPQRTDYTAIGRAANLGARICSVAQPGQVLVSQDTYNLLRGRVEATPISGLQLKGIGDDVTAYHVLRVM
jgi:adenylate cyclase